jgi:hypothetical protein
MDQPWLEKFISQAQVILCPTLLVLLTDSVGQICRKLTFIQRRSKQPVRNNNTTNKSNVGNRVSQENKNNIGNRVNEMPETR